MKWIVMALALVSGGLSAAQYTEVEVEGLNKTIKVEITGMQVKVPLQCEEKFCDSADTDCDGVLDNTCTGLMYNVCKDGSVVDAYMDAALSGFCVGRSEPAAPPSEVVYCDEGKLVVSPAVCVER